MKRSYENINKKNIRNIKVVYLHEESFVLLLDSPLHVTSCFIVIRKQFYCDVEETICTTNSSVALPELQATAVDCAHELINGKSGKKRGGWQYSPKFINGDC